MRLARPTKTHPPLQHNHSGISSDADLWFHGKWSVHKYIMISWKSQDEPEPLACISRVIDYQHSYFTVQLLEPYHEYMVSCVRSRVKHMTLWHISPSERHSSLSFHYPRRHWWTCLLMGTARLDAHPIQKDAGFPSCKFAMEREGGESKLERKWEATTELVLFELSSQKAIIFPFTDCRVWCWSIYIYFTVHKFQYPTTIIIFQYDRFW